MRMIKKEVSLKVSEAFQQDVGYGRARIDHQTRMELDLSIGDVIGIDGQKQTASVVWRAHPTDEGKRIIRIDNLTRKNAGVGLGDNVTVKKAVVKPARTVTLAPLISKGQQIQFGSGIEVLIKKGLLKRPITKGDNIIIPGIALFGSALPFAIINTNPSDIVSISEETVIKVKEEAAQQMEPEGPRVSYEDIGGLKDELERVKEMIQLPIKHPKIFNRLGIDPPKGVLLHGPPGTGKTLIAKAVANESGASFYTINGPEIMCVDGDTKILTNPKGHVSAKELFERDGRKINSSIHDTIELDLPISTFSFKDGEITKGKITHVTKLSAPTYEVCLSDGNNLKTSSNQPFLIYEQGSLTWKRVCDISKGDYVARINHFETKEITHCFHPESLENIIEKDGKYCINSRNLSRSNFIRLPNESSNDLMEFLGLLISDGNISKNGDAVTFSNNDSILIDRYIQLLENIFDITKTKRYPDGRVVVYSKTLIMFLDHIGFSYKTKLTIPGYFYTLQKSQIRSFIRGYFDGDGTVAMTEEYPTPKLFSKSKEFLRDLQSLLQIKLEISSKINIHNTPKGNFYELVVRGYEGRLKFIDIGSSTPSKMKRLEKIKKVRRIKDFKDVPFPSVLVSEIKEKLDYNQYRNKDYNIYQTGNITKHALTVLYTLAADNEILSQATKDEYQTLMRDDIGWERVEEIEYVGEQELYDFTVDKDSFIGGPYFFLHNSKFYGQSEENLRKIFDEAENNAPSIVFIDEIDAIAGKRSETHGEVEKRVVSQLLTLMDGLKGRGKLIVIGATNIPDSLDPALRRPGRFDREIRIDAPDRDGRKEIIQIHTRGMPKADNVDLDKLSDRTYGFVGADLAALAREAAMNALRRYLPEIDLDKPIPIEILEKMEVTMDDFKNAQRGIEPSAMREFFVEIPRVTWEDVGGLEDVKQQLIESVEWPLSQPEVFKRLGIKAPHGILLYGPPGTGKTLLAKAVANESDANFISIKGPEVMSKWVGESEKAVRELFKKAKQVAPSIVFLDELDAIAPRRGAYSGSHVTESVVNQLLTSIDGLESMEGVIIIGATNRPDIVDSSLLRPGRFDRLIMTPAPDLIAREEIFKIHAKNMPLSKDVSLSDLAKEISGFSGADIEALCREAAMIALRENIKVKKVTNDHFTKAMGVIRATLTEDLINYYLKVSKELGSGIAKKDKRDKDIQYT